MAEVPHERSLVKRFAKSFTIIGVNSDKDRAAARKLCAEKGISWRSFWDGGSTTGPIQKRWNINAWPTLYLLDAAGVIRYKGAYLRSLTVRQAKDGKWEQVNFLDEAVAELVRERNEGAPTKRSTSKHAEEPPSESAAGWVKHPEPVLGGQLGTCFDISVLKEGDVYRMWFSWRPKKSIALVESKDGVHWSKPLIVLGPNDKTDWENDLNRPVVLKKDGRYEMWYTGQARGKSWIGFATSPDGKEWRRMSARPVLAPEQPWEKVAVMCPHVLYDQDKMLYRMWYSGGEQYEPNAIGYATSTDGLKWARHANNPVFKPDPKKPWEKDRVTGSQVLRHGNWHLMFYIGFRDAEHAQIGVARSKDGITGWERHRANPIIRPGQGKWDHDAVYKPYAIFDGRRWLLWYNGRRGGVEQIGLAVHDGEDLEF